MLEKKIWGVLFLLLLTTSAWAQRITVSGSVMESDGKTPIEQATVQILSLPDSTYVNGCVTNGKGYFTLPPVRPGEYVLKYSFVGYLSQVKALTLSRGKSQVNVGIVRLSDDAVMLKEAVVVAQAAQVEVVADTVQYNVSAYRVPEGSALEELVKKIPGAELTEDGKITLNGKDITKILVNGKEFFSGDTQVAMKNLTVDMVEKIKAYDKKSDLARVTGIDDGEEEAVLDLTMKKGQNQGMFGNLDAGYGTKDRYTSRLMFNRFADHSQFSIMGNMNNTNDMGFPGGGGGFRMGNNNGLTARKTLGANFALETKHIETGGNLRYSYTGTDVQSVSSSHNFQSGQYSKSRSASQGSSWNLNFDYRLEWKPDSLNNIIFRPRASHSENESLSDRFSVTTNTDPEQDVSILGAIKEFLDGKINPFDVLTDQQKKNIINAQSSQSLSNSKNNNISGELQFNHKFGNSGRNLTLRATGGYSDGSSESFSNNDQWYFQMGDSTSLLRRYINTPTKNYNYSAQFTYSEPLARGVFLQFRYQFQHRLSKSDKQAYDLSSLLYGTDNAIGTLPIGYLDFPDKDLSKYVENSFDNHDISLTLRLMRNKWQLSAGATYRPQHSKTSYQQGKDMTELKDFTRNYNNVSPTVDFRYNFSKQSRLRIEWRSNASQPSVNNLIPVIDNSNPLSVSAGNPELKPSYTNNIRLTYNTFMAATQTSIMTNVNVRTTSNSVSNMTVYNNVTGGQVSMPMNIDGNWNAMGMFIFNTALKDKRFTIGSFSNVSFNNMASYYNDGTKAQFDTSSFENFYNSFMKVEAVKNITKSLNLSERLNFNFRTTLFDLGLTGNFQYTSGRNSLRTTANTDNFNFSYGINGNLNLPWGMSISTDLSNSSRRGYSDASFNTDELLWNAQITQSFLKGKAATLTLQFYDILRQQSNVSRSITAAMQSDTEYNAINSYAMLKFSYRLNLMGSKDMRDRMRRGPGGFGGFGGPRPGGFGGPRPGGRGM